VVRHHGGKPILRGQIGNLILAWVIEQRINMNEHSVHTALNGLAECLFDFRISAGIHDHDFHA
jgi:hypothetical protein